MMLNGLFMAHHLMLVLQDQDTQRPLTAAAAKDEAEMADKDLAKLIVLTPSRKNGLDAKSGSHSHHAASALTEGLRLFDEVHLLLMLSTALLMVLHYPVHGIQHASGHR